MTLCTLLVITVAAGLKMSVRSKVQAQWMSGEVPVIVATISFGRGVDKANVRQVSVMQSELLYYTNDAATAAGLWPTGLCPSPWRPITKSPGVPGGTEMFLPVGYIIPGS